MNFTIQTEAFTGEVYKQTDEHSSFVPCKC